MCTDMCAMFACVRSTIAAVASEIPIDPATLRNIVNSGRVRILRWLQRQIRQRGDRYEQERNGDGLGTSHDRQRLEVDVRHQVMRVKQRARHQEEAETDQVAGLYDRHQLADHRNDGHDHHRARRQHEARERRGVTQLLLRKLRHEHRAAIEDGCKTHHAYRAQREILVLQYAYVDHRFFRVEQPEDRAHYADRRENGEGCDETGLEPVIVLAAIEEYLQAAET